MSEDSGDKKKRDLVRRDSTGIVRAATSNLAGRALELSRGLESSSNACFQGRVVCWGSKKLGQCDVPQRLITEADDIVSVHAGNGITAALLKNGSSCLWGKLARKDPQFDVADIPSELPVRLKQIALPLSSLPIPGMGEHVIGLDDKGIAHSWGCPRISTWLTRVNQHVPKKCVQVSASGGMFSLLYEDGSTMSRGPAPGAQEFPACNAESLEYISAGFMHVVGIDNLGGLVEIGSWTVDKANRQKTPGQGLFGRKRYVHVVASNGVALALTKKGEPVAWSWDGASKSNINPPIGDLFAQVAIGVRGTQFIGIRKDGSLATWGKGPVDHAEMPEGLIFDQISMGVDHCVGLIRS